MRKRFLPFATAALIGASLPAWSDDTKKPDGPKPGDAPPKQDVKGSVTARKIDDLMQALASNNDAEREIAEAELSKRGKEGLAPLLVFLQSPANSLTSRLAACRVIRKILAPAKGAEPDTVANPALLGVYHDSSASLELRGECAIALGDLRAKQAIPDLIEGLNDNWFKISESSREALVRVGRSAVDQVVAAYKKELDAKNGRDGIIYRSILILGDVGGDTARTVLAEAIKTTKGSRALAIRAHAARALGLTADPKSIEPLMTAYEQEREFDVAETIERSLEWLTDQHDIPKQPLRWRAWWEAHKDRVLGNARDDENLDKILIPKGGIKKGDPLQAPNLPPVKPDEPKKPQ